jgi:hypothetical protein
MCELCYQTVLVLESCGYGTSPSYVCSRARSMSTGDPSGRASSRLTTQSPRCSIQTASRCSIQLAYVGGFRTRQRTPHDGVTRPMVSSLGAPELSILCVLVSCGCHRMFCAHAEDLVLLP